VPVLGTSGNIGTLGSGFSGAGIGNLNRDGYSDILLQNNTTLALWEMKGATIIPGSRNMERWEVAFSR
jgi:hypothetical protein